jgi:hypothetical protein
VNDTYHRLYDFWVGQQGVPGSLLGDFLVFLTTYLVGKYRVAPWLHSRHTEHLEQKERQHQELLDAHQRLLDLHTQHHAELLEAVQGAATPPPVDTIPPYA